MRIHRHIARVLGLGLALLLAVPPVQAQQQTAPVSTPASTASLPDSPSASLPPAPQQQSLPPQTAKPKPAGTAASEMTNVGGVTASEPAGVAIAPAKQRRSRSFLIKMGAILGAGAALGTVAALSASGGSKPPGAH